MVWMAMSVAFNSDHAYNFMIELVNFTLPNLSLLVLLKMGSGKGEFRIIHTFYGNILGK